MLPMAGRTCNCYLAWAVHCKLECQIAKPWAEDFPSLDSLDRADEKGNVRCRKSALTGRWLVAGHEVAGGVLVVSYFGLGSLELIAALFGAKKRR